VLRRHRAAQTAGPAGPDQDVALDELVSDDAEAPRRGGLQSQWTGGPALATKLATGALWTALLAGPAALLLAGSSALVAAPAAPAPAVVDRAGEQAAAAEFAGRLVRLWLTSVRGQEDQLRALVPGTDISLPEVAWASGPMTTADVRRQPDGTWLVVTAVTGSAAAGAPVARPAADSRTPAPAPTVRFYAVPVRVDDVGLVALTLPAPVPAPTTASAGPRLGYRHQVAPTDPLVASVGQFLAALLTGTGEVTRYVSPGAAINPVTPAPYTAVEVSAVVTDHELVAGAAAPADGTRLRVLVTAKGTAGPQQYAVVQYPLTFTVRGGRWEVTAIDPAPALQPPTSQTSSPASPVPSNPAPPN